MVLVLGRVESPAERRRRLRMTVDLPQVLELLAAAMQAGLPLRGAVREVAAVTQGPLGEDLRGVLSTIDLGSPDADAWRGLRDHPALGRVSIDLARSVDSGSMVVATLRRNAQLARRDRQGALEARARTVGVRSVPPLMICFVPAFLLICVVPIVVTAIGQAIG
jgi:pilus assembly protein TadC